MSKKLFTQEEILELRVSPYVESVTVRSVAFTSEFKQKAYDELNDGKTIKQIFELNGINTSILGDVRIQGFKDRLFAEYEQHGRTSRNSSSACEDKAYIKKLEHELAYAKQVIEFLKKIQEADVEARKKWEAKPNHK